MLTSLQDDLLQEFRAERNMVNEQIEVLDPLGTNLRKPAAQRIISSGGLILLEICCYLLSAGTIAFMVFMHRIFPFSMLQDMLYNPQYRSDIGLVNIGYLNIAIYGLAAVPVILFYVLARTCRRIRLKNDILQMAGNDIKIIVGQILKRKAAIEAIEQRHLLDIPGVLVNQPPVTRTLNVNDVPNPGYTDKTGR